MTPLLSTRHPWQLHFGETPPPGTLPREIDVVRVSMGLGMAAIDALIDSGHRVGPLLCCLTHRKVLIPVASGTAHLWGASHSVCDTGPSLTCAMQGLQPVCHRFWITPPEPLAHPTTDSALLHDRLSLMRDRMRHIAQPTSALCALEVCHV